MDNTCTVIGGTAIPAEKTERLTREMQIAVESAIDLGYDHFISGFTGAADIAFAAIVAKKRAEHPDIRLEAAIEYRERLFTLMEDANIKPVLLRCDTIGIHGEKPEEGSRSRLYEFLIRNSDCVIAMSGGGEDAQTARAVRRAYNKNRNVWMIDI